jgi:hypothetical protein
MSKFVDVISVPSLDCNCCGAEDPRRLSVECGALVCSDQCLNDQKEIGEALYEDSTTRMQIMAMGSPDTSVILVTNGDIGIERPRNPFHRKNKQEKDDARKRREAARQRSEERREDRHRTGREKSAAATEKARLERIRAQHAAEVAEGKRRAEFEKTRGTGETVSSGVSIQAILKRSDINFPILTATALQGVQNLVKFADDAERHFFGQAIQALNQSAEPLVDARVGEYTRFEPYFSQVMTKAQYGMLKDNSTNEQRLLGKLKGGQAFIMIGAGGDEKGEESRSVVVHYKDTSGNRFRTTHVIVEKQAGVYFLADRRNRTEHRSLAELERATSESYQLI